MATITVSSTFCCRHLVKHLRHCCSTQDRLAYVTGSEMCTVFRLYGISSSYKPFFFFFPNALFSFTCSSLRSPMHAQAPVEYLMGWSAIWTGVNATIVAPQLFWVKWGGVAHMTLSLRGAGQIETFKTSEDPSVRYSTSSPTARTQISFRIPGKNAHYELFTNWTQVKAFTNLINTLLIELTGEKERKTLQTNLNSASQVDLFKPDSPDHLYSSSCCVQLRVQRS